MFIGATQVTLAKAPLDASSVAIQVAIMQQREFEEALRVTQERRESEQASERARSLERQERENAEEKINAELESDTAKEGKQAVVLMGSGQSSQSSQSSRGTSLDVTA